MAQSTWTRIVGGMPAALHKAYVRKSARQRAKAEVAEAWAAADDFADGLRSEVERGAYRVGRYRHFRLHSHDKVRDISVLPFRDRVAQNAVKEAIEPCLMRLMTDDQLGGLPGRGVLARRRRYSVEAQMRRLMTDGTLTHYVKADVRKFYDHVDNVVAMRLVERVVTDRRTRAIVRQHIFAQKRLAIGDPFSHVVASAVMSDVMRRLKREHPALRVVNYADDVFVAGRSVDELRAAIRTLRRAARSVRLRFKPMQVHPMPTGGEAVTFCGLRYGRGFVRLTRRLKVRYVRSRHRSRSVASYNGIVGRADTRRLRRLVEQQDNRHMADFAKIHREFTGRKLKIDEIVGIKHDIVHFAEKKSRQPRTETYMHVQGYEENLGVFVYTTSSAKIMSFLRTQSAPLMDMRIVSDWSGKYYEGTVYTEEEESAMIREKLERARRGSADAVAPAERRERD